MSDTNNPYATPNAAVSDVFSEEGFGDLKLFTSKGRIGRLRYILYSLGVTLAGGLLVMLAAFIPFVGPFLAIAIYIGLFVIVIFLTIQRCHDFNTTGWMALVMLIPLVSLIFYFIPGTKATNQYGLQPPPNSTGVKVGAFLVLGLFVFGMVAAIVMPGLMEGLPAQ